MRATLASLGFGEPTERSGLGPLWQAAIALLFAAIATGALLGLALSSKRITFLILAILAFVITFALTGNRRLFFLWGLILTTPLGASKALFVSSSAHMGGASAISIDLCDFFLLPLLLFILRDYARGWRTNLRFSPLLWWWGAMMLLGVMDLVFGPWRTLAGLEVIRMLKCYLLFFVIVNEVVRVRQFVHVFAALLIDIAVQALTTIIQFFLKGSLGLQFLGEPPLAVTETATESVYRGTHAAFRAGGLFSHPNLLGGFMALLLPICIALLFSGLRPLFKLLIGGVVVLGLAALVISLSRSAMLSFGAAFTVLFAFSMLHRKLSLRYVMARVLVIIGMVAAIGLTSGDITRRFTESDPGALNFRYEMMDVAWRMILDHPVLGLGLNTFVAHLPEYTDPPGPRAVTERYGPDWPVVHDSYLITWTEQGTIGFACLVGFYLCILRTGWKSSRHLIDDVVYAFNLGATCGIIAIMVDGIGSFFINEPQSTRVFWMVVGLIFALNYWTRANLPVRQPRQQAARPRHALVPA